MSTQINVIYAGIVAYQIFIYLNNYLNLKDDKESC